MLQTPVQFGCSHLQLRPNSDGHFMYGLYLLLTAVPSDLSPKSQEYVLSCAKAAGLFCWLVATVGLPSVSLIPHHLACITALESSHEESKDASSSSEGIIVVVDLPANTASVSLVSSSVCSFCLHSL